MSEREPQPECQRPWQISRRTMLRGVGAMMALPLLEAMGDAAGAPRILAILEAMHDFYREPRYRPSPWLRRRAALGTSLLTPE